MSRKVIEGIAKGRREVFLDFYNRVSVQFLKFIYFRAGGDIDRANDVFQEAFARMIDSRKQLLKLQSDDMLFPWLCGVSRRILADGFREKKSKKTISLEKLDPVVQEAILQIESGELTETAAAHPQLQTLVGMVMSSLNPDHADVLKAKYCERRSVEEIANEKGESEKAIEGKLYRARESFRTVFQRVRKEAETGYAG